MDDIPPPFPAPPPVAVPGRKATRVQGWLLIVIGLGLSVTMAVVAGSLYQTIALPGLTGGRSRWHGDPAFTRTTFELFGTIFAFGIFSMGAGTFQACTGRRNRLLVAPLLLLGVVMIYLGHGIITAGGSAR